MIVTAHNTAIAMGSGDLSVFATPAMIALMEKAAMELAAQYCEPGQTTVGTRVNVDHKRATAVGREVEARAELISQEGRKLTFRVVATDERGEIGSGEHDRFIVDREKFMSKL